MSDGGREERMAERVPVWCPLCEEFMKGSQSTRTYYDWGCCMHCHVEFVEDREQRWINGWRPTKEEVVKKRGGRIWDVENRDSIKREDVCGICFKAPWACRGHDKHEF